MSILLFLFLLLPTAGAQNQLIRTMFTHIGGNEGLQYLSGLEKFNNGYLMGGIISTKDPYLSCNTADTLGNAWLFFTDTIGNLVWSRCYGGSESDGFKIVKKGHKETIWAVGQFGSPNGDFYNDSSSNRVFVGKFDSVGTPIWHRFYGGPADNSLADFITTADGGGILLLDFNYAGADIPYKYDNNPFSTDTWLCKIDSVGTIEWTKVLGGTGQEKSTKVKQLRNGGFMTVINTTSVDSMLAGLRSDINDYDPWFCVFDSAGNLESSKVVLGGDPGAIIDFQPTTNNGLIMVGSQQTNANNLSPCYPGIGSTDFVVIKVDSLYHSTWCAVNGGTNSEGLRKIVAINDSLFAVEGTGQSTDIDFEHCSAYSSTNNHTWLGLFSLNEQGAVWKRAFCGSLDDEITDMIYVDSTLVVLMSGISTDGDFGSAASNPEENNYLLKYKLSNVTNVVNIALSNEHIQLYPNPAAEYCTLQLSSYNNDYSAQLMDITGRNLTSLKITNSVTQIPITNLPAGLYFVKVNDGNGSVGVAKLVKE